VINMSVPASSMVKGETLIDTAMTLNAMHPDVLVVRHPESGAVHLLSEKVDRAVVNAGDGSHEHPTQALLDALPIGRRKGRLGGLTVAICGDVLHSRVARLETDYFWPARRYERLDTAACDAAYFVLGAATRSQATQRPSLLAPRVTENGGRRVLKQQGIAV
jgi:hypothetical protein